VSWDEDYKKLCLQIDAWPLLVLSWGPGTVSPDFPKRQAIVDRVKRDLPNVDIRMSEDKDLKILTGGRFLDEQDEEGAQALIADAIIALDASRGAGEEIAKYSNSSKIATKMFVLTPEKYVGSGSFPDLVRKGLKCYPYSDDEFNNDKLGDICVEFLRAVILRKILKS